MTTLDRWLLHEGSTRSAALLRILLGLLVWVRWGAWMRPTHSLEGWQLALAAAFWVSSIGFVLGVQARGMAALLGGTLLAAYWGEGVFGGHPHLVAHHTYLLSWSVLLMSLVPCDRSYSVSRWWAVRRAEAQGRPAPAERGAVWGLSLLAVQVSAVYLWGTYDKLDPAFLSGERLEIIFMALYTGADYPSLPGFHILCVAAAWVTVLLEAWLTVALWHPRTRTVSLGLGLALHLLFYLGMPVHTFSATMAALYLAFLDPDAVHRFLDELQGHP